MIHINLNMIFYIHVEHSPTKIIYVRYMNTPHTHTHTHTQTKDCSYAFGTGTGTKFGVTGTVCGVTGGFLM